MSHHFWRAGGRGVLLHLGLHPSLKMIQAGAYQVRGPLPDPVGTPGAVFPNVTAAQVCVPGYARSVRSVSQAEKDAVFHSYGIASHLPNEFEIDHLISLELGGTNDLTNLWPEAAEPRPGFHEKDKVEGFCHQEVCAGRKDLATVQHQIATDWTVLWTEMQTHPAAGMFLGAPESLEGLP